MKEIVCFAYIEVSREPDDAPDKAQRLKGLRKSMASVFHQPEDQIEKTLAKLDVAKMDCRELAETIKKGLKDE